jgi:hypothetical protein
MTATWGTKLENLANMSNSVSSIIGLGTTIGGFFGGGGSSAQKLDAKRTRRMEARYAAKELPSLQVYGWKKAGIHPLAGIGLNPSAGVQSMMSGGPDEQSIADMGQNLSRAIGSVVQGRRDKELHELAVEKAKADIDLIRAQTTNISKQAGDPRVQLIPDQSIASQKGNRSMTAGSNKPAPMNKAFIQGTSKFGEEIYINAPPSGQWDERGEVYSGIKTLEWLKNEGFLIKEKGRYYVTGRKHGKLLERLGIYKNTHRNRYQHREVVDY